ncbi:MAG: hypothetical protein P8Y42_07585 [Exilibacterium sp.]
MFQGVEAYRHQHFPKAFQCFGAAREIADWLVEQENPLTTSRCTAVDMWALAGHNLFATLCAMGAVEAAEKAVRSLHQKMLGLCLQQWRQRQVRVAALANLDVSLFSLASYLGQRGKVAKIHRLIAQTDRAAETSAKQLFH